MKFRIDFGSIPSSPALFSLIGKDATDLEEGSPVSQPATAQAFLYPVGCPQILGGNHEFCVDRRLAPMADKMSPEMPPSMMKLASRRNRFMEHGAVRSLLLVIGWLSVAGGVIGIFLPLVPTVPLLLLAVTCFARSSDRFHRWLLEHARLGPLVRDYLDGAGIPRRARLSAITMVWVSVAISAWFVPRPWVRILLLGIAVCITIYLLRLPERKLQDGGIP